MPDAEYLEIIFIELSKLPENAGSGMREQWVKFLSVKTGKELEMLAKQSHVMEKAKNRLVRVSASQRILFAMDRAEKHERDRISFFEAGKEDARAEGRAEGIAKGRAEGIAKGRAEGVAKGRAEGIAKGMAKGIAKVVKNMKAEGFDNAVIAKVTKLSMAEIERL
jgi:flagellar biosynthesis/type III secretory pathway protein FliH